MLVISGSTAGGAKDGTLWLQQSQKSAMKVPYQVPTEKLRKVNRKEKEEPSQKTKEKQKAKEDQRTKESQKTKGKSKDKGKSKGKNGKDKDKGKSKGKKGKDKDKGKSRGKEGRKKEEEGREAEGSSRRPIYLSESDDEEWGPKWPPRRRSRSPAAKAKGPEAPAKAKEPEAAAKAKGPEAAAKAKGPEAPAKAKGPEAAAKAKEPVPKAKAMPKTASPAPEQIPEKYANHTGASSKSTYQAATTEEEIQNDTAVESME